MDFLTDTFRLHGYHDYGVFAKGTPASQAIPILSAAGIGFVTVLWVFYNIAQVLLSLFILPGKSLRSFGPRGSWAVVTGASDGIGKEYAHALAKAGYNLVLVSRTESKLQSLSSTLTEKSADTRVEILPMDFAANRDEDYSSLSSILNGKHIAVLINNVGQSHSIPVPFVETTTEEMNNIITVNCTGTLKVTQLVLPSMLQNQNGLILTMGSFGGLAPTPLLATYSGSKAFLQQWSNALASEVATSGITVYLVHSYLVTSAMSKIRKASLFVPNEKTFVRSVLSKIGRRGGSIGYTYSGSPYWSHGFMAAVVLTLGAYSKRLLDFNRNMHVTIRQKALAKAEKNRAKVQ